MSQTNPCKSKNAQETRLKYPTCLSGGPLAITDGTEGAETSKQANNAVL